jgi:hypothetical protein
MSAFDFTVSAFCLVASKRRAKTEAFSLWKCLTGQWGQRNEKSIREIRVAISVFQNVSVSAFGLS